MINNAQQSIPPDSWLGVLGGGQLGRMFTQAAQKLGYRVLVLTPENNSPAAQVADDVIESDYNDLKALASLVKRVKAVTIEFENLPSESLEFLEGRLPVRPGAQVLHTTQNRLREKNFLLTHHIPVVPFMPIENGDLEALYSASEAFSHNAVLKTAGFGYDGKGQYRIRRDTDCQPALEALQGQPSILEAWIDGMQEFSVIGVRGVDGNRVTYGPLENHHKNHILDVTISPTELLNQTQRDTAIQMTRRLLSDLDVVGLLTVEFFLLANGEILVNEMAPRPHNSGHYTLDACLTSQFEQQVRALCGLPLGSSEQHSEAIMLNLLGDWWFSGKSEKTATRLEPSKHLRIEPNWVKALSNPNASLHLYGKSEARPGRKMGHLTFLNTSLEMALSERDAIRFI